MRLARPWSTSALLVGMAFWTLSALGGGPGLFLFRDGSGLGFDPELLVNTPFADFFAPGVILALLGVAGAVVTALLVRGLRARGRRDAPSPWQWYFALVVALGQLAWMVGEVALLWRPVAGLPGDQRELFHTFWWAFGAVSVVNLLLVFAQPTRRILGGPTR
ncbi:hypothetical protein [Dietzia sp. UBA5065]|uniref:hypothetical protein n=1 Tax=Dietzia sp. UBA5065 TaxID=1946422 RepID=UPI0025BED6D8|nr:hypothetical protein [Dietzia sp. UBA5065]